MFQGGLAIQEHFQVVWVVQVLDERGVRNHRLQEFAQRVVAAPAAFPAVEIAEEALQQVVGALGLNEPWSLGRLHGDGLAKSLFPYLSI